MDIEFENGLGIGKRNDCTQLGLYSNHTTFQITCSGLYIGL